MHSGYTAMVGGLKGKWRYAAKKEIGEKDRAVLVKKAHISRGRRHLASSSTERGGGGDRGKWSIETEVYLKWGVGGRWVSSKEEVLTPSSGGQDKAEFTNRPVKHAHDSPLWVREGGTLFSKSAELRAEPSEAGE